MAFLKGKLSKLAVFLFGLVQTPGAFMEVVEIGKTFVDATQSNPTFGDAATSLGTLIAFLVMIWGGGRAQVNYKIPKLKLVIPDDEVRDYVGD